MDLTRRFALSFLALVAVTHAASGQTGDDKPLADAVEALRKAMLDPTKEALDPLLADEMSYGHSSGRVETKAQFVDSLIGKKSVFKSITISDQTIKIVGNDAIVRHVFSGEVESGGKVSPVKIGILQVWLRQGGGWKLLARQAVAVQG